MGLRLLLYLLLLVVGGFIGYKDIVGEKIKSKLGLIQSICLLFLLFIMGTRIGLDDKVISSFFELGFKAVVFSIFTIFFSILFVRMISKFIIGKKKEEKSNES